MQNNRLNNMLKKFIILKENNIYRNPNNTKKSNSNAKRKKHNRIICMCNWVEEFSRTSFKVNSKNDTSKYVLSDS